jgi:CRISPR-associated endonuclease/helicase Cas3
MKSSQFPTFFEALHKRQPFPWQVTLAERVCSEGWPDVIDLPTASGKTACIDIALFAMAVTNAAPRRVFFVVDRRVIVNEAFERANKIAGKLAEAKHGVLAEVAARLRELARGPDPLQVCELRGGIYRDASWVRNPLQPLVVTSTVDQTGSRLLFRGYGVSESSAPIHAGLIANDAILFLDEAHSSRAFAQTLTSISKYRSGAWAEQPLLSPFAFVEMTATPSRRSEDPFRLGEADRENEVLKKRLRTPKPTRLVTSKGAVEKTLVEEFLSLVGEAGQIRSGAIMVNRVSTARRTHALLMEQGRAAELVIGRMRPLDRDDQMGRLDPIHSGKPRDGGPPVFVVSTQCLETGADLDFDVLVSECASIDALQQRFGRLDRLGEFGRAKGAIVIGANQVKPKQPDPIYGEALVLTWKLLQGLVSVNMGIEAAPEEPLTVAQRIRQLPEEEANALRRIGPDAPILLPSHVDAFSQTSPRPSVDPDPALFLHGPKEGSPDVQVVWRIDLKEGEEALWAAIVALCPPVSAEAMPVPIHEFRRWLAEEDQDPNASDLESAEDGSGLPGPAGRPILAWRGDKSKVVSDPRDLRPGDTLVIPISYEGWEALGHKPEQADPDLAERAYFVSRQKLRIRLHPDVIETWKATDS